MAFVWVLLLLVELHCLLAYSRNITISVDGNDSTSCCVNGDCFCSSLQHALQNISNDTELINIISSQVLLPTVVTITNHNTIEIVGSNHTVVTCNDTGRVLFLNCTNVSILDITWDHCGDNLAGGVSVNYSESLLISSCKFQHSLAYGVTVEVMVGVITITDTEILNNSVLSNSAGGFLLRQTNKTAKLEVNIINCSFKFNGYKRGHADGGGINVQTISLTSLLSVSIENCVISNNHAYRGGGIFVDANVTNFAITFTNVTVTDNYASSGDAIHCFTPGGNNASFIIKGSSNLIEGSSINLGFSSSMTSISMEDLAVAHTAEQYMLFRIDTYSNSNLTISFSEMNLLRTRVQLRVNQHPESCILKFNKLIANNNSSLSIDGSESNGFQCSITNCQFLNNSDNIAVVNIHNKNPRYNDGTQVPTIQIINSSFTHNRNGDSVVRLMYDEDETNPPLGEVQLSSTTFANNIDNDNTLYLYHCNLTISNKIIFKGNSAIKGAGIYFTNLSIAMLQSHADMEFIDNTAALGGGAIYVEYLYPDKPSHCPYTLTMIAWPVFYTANEYTATFSNNRAHAAGNSIFFSIPKDYASCIDRNLSSSSSLLHIPTHFNYSGQNEIATSPYNLQLGAPAVCNGSCTDGGIYQVKGIMLGEEFSVVTKMVGYYNNSAEPTLFEIRCSENCQHYNLTGSDNFEYKFIQTNKTINISIIGDEVKTDSVIVLEMSSVVATINSDVRVITVKIEVTLTPCHFGFIYDNDKKVCLCNNKVADIVKCGLDGIKLKRGYWYGEIGYHIVVGYCPNNFCNYATSCKSSDKFCDLSKFSDGQCNLHRIGPACGKCQNNYSLSLDSTDCVPDSLCSAWWTALIITIMVIYWLGVSFTIIFMVYFITAPTMLGYVYGIIYFYSVIDLLVSNDLPISNGMVQFIEILSGLVNLTPRFLGSLCLAKGLSGIDQQVIHYVHPFAILLLLLLIPKVAKCCKSLSSILNRVGTVRSLCLLLLLCYTSVSSTSLKLLLPLTFKGTHTTYAYYSPNIEYFTGRHVFYGIAAIFFTLVIVLGLPIFLLLQPLLRRCQRIPFIRIKHILDQFQQCYKREYHWAAGIYLICRLLIFVTVGLNSVEYVTSYFVLQVLCFIVAVVHIILRPYRDDKVNSLDHIILLIAVMVVGLNTNNLFLSLSADKAINDFIVIMFVLLPLISFIGFILLTLKEKYSRLKLHIAKLISYYT